jgi:Ser/Thr protein kinase RdoA (MazF antagonist)
MSMLMEPVLEWAADQLGVSRQAVVGVDTLLWARGPWRLRIDHDGTTVEAVLRVGGPDPPSRQQLVTEAAALTFAEAHQLAAPRLLAADLDLASAPGRAVLLRTMLAGSGKIPAVASPERLRALGAAAATLHVVAGAPRPGLPLRTRPLADVDFAAARRASGSSPLLDASEEHVDQVPVPAGMSVFVHGDLWQGNTVWNGQALVGMVDWDVAGVGHPGIDLGTLRLDAALTFGLPAAAEVLEGWQRAAGRPADAMAYWDLVAALTTPADMGQWLPVAHQYGRADLDQATLTDRRDTFLRAALDQLDHQ